MGVNLPNGLLCHGGRRCWRAIQGVQTIGTVKAYARSSIQIKTWVLRRKIHFNYCIRFPGIQFKIAGSVWKQFLVVVLIRMNTDKGMLMLRAALHQRWLTQAGATLRDAVYLVWIITKAIMRRIFTMIPKWHVVWVSYEFHLAHAMGSPEIAVMGQMITISCSGLILFLELNFAYPLLCVQNSFFLWQHVFGYELVHPWDTKGTFLVA